MILVGRLKSARAQQIRERVPVFGANQLEILHELIPPIVDTTLHRLLWSLEETRWVKISVETEAGLVPDQARVSDEFPGELYGDQGRIVRFSGARHHSRLEDQGRALTGDPGRFSRCEKGCEVTQRQGVPGPTQRCGTARLA
jgi:hypothetical protein